MACFASDDARALTAQRLLYGSECLVVARGDGIADQFNLITAIEGGLCGARDRLGAVPARDAQAADPQHLQQCI